MGVKLARRITAGFGLRFVDSRAGNNANTLFLEGYVLADIGLTYHVASGIDATFRVNNLFDKTYVNWAEVSYPGELILRRAAKCDLRVDLEVLSATLSAMTGRTADARGEIMSLHRSQVLAMDGALVGGGTR